MSLVSQIQSLATRIATEVKAKQATLVSGTNIKTVNGTSLIGSGDLTISGGGGSDTFFDGGSAATVYSPSNRNIDGGAA